MDRWFDMKGRKLNGKPTFLVHPDKRESPLQNWDYANVGNRFFSNIYAMPFIHHNVKT